MLMKNNSLLTFPIQTLLDFYTELAGIKSTVQPFLDFRGFNFRGFDFRGFDFRNFRFNAVYNSILFSSLLVLLSNLDLRGFCFPRFFMCPHINSVIRGMPDVVFLISFLAFSTTKPFVYHFLGELDICKCKVILFFKNLKTLFKK